MEVLDKGFVKLVDYLGGDKTVVNSARVSYDGVSKGEEADNKLIEYLYNNEHLTPFEHCQITFHVKCPIFVARQWFRHRTGKYNEISGRYVEFKDEYYIPDAHRICGQSKDNKQCSGDALTLDVQRKARDKIEEACNNSFKEYYELLNSGVAREIARGVLPLNTYTQFYFTIDLRNLFNFIKLRLHSHAQYEIQVYAEKMLEIIKKLYPVSTKVFCTKNNIEFRNNVDLLN
jgi:thymidylate synthase (FAD)